MEITIPGYLIQEKIYESDNCLVCKAIRQSDKFPIIVKTLNENKATKESIARFKHSYQIIKTLKIPGINKTYDFLKINDSFIAIYEDIDGIDLSYLVKEEIPLDLFLEIAIKITQILGDIHKSKIIHKNINPQNIIYNENTKELRIIDFGNASTLEKEWTDVQDLNLPEKYLPYISPEQTGRLNRFLDYRTDFYSLGITFYELITGKKPFESHDTIGWIHKHIVVDPVNPAIVNPKIPKPITDIILKLMNKNPEERYQSSAGLIYDLNECLKQLNEKKEMKISSYGKKDFSGSFKVSQKFVGRQSELLVLKDCFNNVLNGKTEIAFVFGDPVAGKTFLVKQIRQEIIPKNGFFIEAEAQEFDFNIPYKAINNAFGNFIKQLQRESAEQFNYWREKILEAVGPNAQLIINIIPELETIIGKQPELSKLNPDKENNRFMLTSNNFLKVFASKEHPLVIFIDNLHWCDLPSIKWIENLITFNEIPYLFLICAYRTKDLLKFKSLEFLINRIKEKYFIKAIELKPFSEEEVNQIVVNTFNCDLNHPKKLSQVIHQKTLGNPFFVGDLLNKLYKKKVILFNLESHTWEWTISKVMELESSDNVMANIINKLSAIGTDLTLLLKNSSCLGMEFDLRTVAGLSGFTINKTASLLFEAVQQGYIISLTENFYLVIANDSTFSEINFNDFNAFFKFPYEKIQQAYYSMLSEFEKAQKHVSIGQLLLEQTPKEALKKRLIEIVSHFNKGKSEIIAREEKLKLILLNLKAAKQAKQVSAYDIALGLLTTSKEFLPFNSWDKEYKLTYEIFKEYAECACFNSKFELAEDSVRTLIKYSKSNVDKANIYHSQIIQYVVQGNPDKSIDAGLKGLECLGIKISTDPSKLLILKEIIIAKFRLRKFADEDILKLPEIKDEKIIAIINLLSELASPAYINKKENLFAFTILRLLNITIKYGRNIISASAFAAYALLLNTVFQDFNAGYRYGKVALSLNEQLENPELSDRAPLIFSIFILPWNQHWSNINTYLKRVLYSGFKYGDFLYLASAWSNTTLWEETYDLKKALSESKNNLDYIKSMQNIDMLNSSNCKYHFFLSLVGATNEIYSLNSQVFNEEKCLNDMKKTKYVTGIAMYYLFKAEICFMYDNYDEAQEYFVQFDAVKKAVAGLTYSMEYIVYSFLNYSYLIPELGKKEKKQAKKHLFQAYKQMRKWATHCPINFLHFQLLMEAELARHSRDFSMAEALYDKAIVAANKSRYLRYAALCNECMAKYYLAEGIKQKAIQYFNQAYENYSTWGATAKLEHLKKKYPEIFPQESKSEQEEKQIIEQKAENLRIN
ncbi:AAA family ATPase [Candidatus Margulisiibacteriota bacterium]